MAHYTRSHSRLWALIVPALFLALAFTWAAPRALADTASNKIELTGTIDSVTSPTLFTVNAVKVDASTAEVKAAIAIGTNVVVEGDLLPDGSVSASEVSPVEGQTTSASKVEIHGTLTSLDSTTAVVNGMTFDITGAQVDPGLVAGDMVVVEATFTSTGWVASEIHLDTQTSTGTCVFQVESSSANLRSGPGTGYDVLGTAAAGDQLTVLQLHTSGDWVNVSSAVGSAWISTETGSLNEEACASLPVSDMPILTASTGTGDQGHDGSTTGTEGEDSSGSGGQPSSGDQGEDSSGSVGTSQQGGQSGTGGQDNQQPSGGEHGGQTGTGGEHGGQGGSDD